MAPLSTVDTLEEIARQLALATDELEALERVTGQRIDALGHVMGAHTLTILERAKLAGVQRRAQLMAAPCMTETRQ
jgi:hypothetical protein